jgi:hypothetical protein
MHRHSSANLTLNIEWSLKHLQQHYQQEFDRCTARDNTTGQHLKRHHHYLQLASISLSAGMGFHSSLIVPRFISTIHRSRQRSNSSGNMTRGNSYMDNGEIPFLNQASPWFSLLQNECDRVGSADTRRMMSRIRPLLQTDDQREEFALVYYWCLLNGYREDERLLDCLTYQGGVKRWIRGWLKTEHHLATEVEEYLFFACFHSWSTSPPANKPHVPAKCSDRN